MPSVARLGDKSSGHECCYTPTPLIQASSNVFVNEIGVARSGDKFAIHGGCIDHQPDQDYVNSRNATVFVNGKAIARKGDSVGPKVSDIAEGSPNVFSGG